MPFLIYDLVPPAVLNGWTVMGELIVLVWHTKIVDTEVYLVSPAFKFRLFLTIFW
jgi:hypothetical protein